MARVTGALKHIHQYYKKYNERGKFTWSCAREGCTHFFPGNMGEPVGMMSMCWSRCGKSFVLTYSNMNEDQPTCSECAEEDIRINAEIERMVPTITKRDRFEQISADALKKATDEVRALKEKMAQQKPDEPDEIEVIEPNEE